MRQSRAFVERRLAAAEHLVASQESVGVQTPCSE